MKRNESGSLNKFSCFKQGLGLPACRRLLFPLLHVEKGHLRNAAANRVPASRWVPKILGTRCDKADTVRIV